MAGFVQIVEFQTQRFDEGQKLVDEYEKATAGTRTVGRAVTGRDRDQPDRYATVVWFPSYDDAMRNSEMPETQKLSAGLAELADGPPTFHNLDVQNEWSFDLVGPGFVQLVQYRTTNPDEVGRLGEGFVAATEGKRTTLRVTVGRDRDQPGAYVTIGEFASYADAMRNSELEATQEFAAKMGALTDGEPVFRNLDVVRTMEA